MTTQAGHLWTVIQSWLDAMTFPPSQAKLAEKLEVSASALSDYKYARHMPTGQTLRKLADVIQVPYEVVLDAALKDHDYRRPDTKDVMGNAEHPAPMNAEAVRLLRAVAASGSTSDDEVSAAVQALIDEHEKQRQAMRDMGQP